MSNVETIATVEAAETVARGRKPIMSDKNLIMQTLAEIRDGELPSPNVLKQLVEGGYVIKSTLKTGKRGRQPVAYEVAPTYRSRLPLFVRNQAARDRKEAQANVAAAVARVERNANRVAELTEELAAAQARLVKANELLREANEAAAQFE